MEPIRLHRLPVIRRAVGGAAWLAVVGACLSLAAASPRDRAVARPGLIVASNIYLRATPFESTSTLVEAMTRLQQPQPISACCGGAWRVHFAALLERPPGDQTLDLEFYEVARAGRPGRRIPVFSSAVAVDPEEIAIFVNDFVICRDLGFVAGHEYEVSLWRRGGTDRTPLAKGSFTLE